MISVIVPCYNSERTLAATIASALDQAIELMKSDPERARRLTTTQSTHAGRAYNWDRRAVEWETFLRSLADGQSE